MKEMHDLEQKLCEELKELTKRGVNHGNLDLIDKLTHSLKSVKTIIAMDEGYQGSQRSYLRSYDGSYDDGSYDSIDAYEYDGRRRDALGRYSRDGQRTSYRSMDDGKSRFLDKLANMAEGAPDRESREAIHNLIDQIK